MNNPSSQVTATGAGAWLSADGAVTGVGSVPHLDAARAVDFVARVAPEVPFWPQLRRRSPQEAMLPQSFGPAMRHLQAVRGEYEYQLATGDVDRFAASLERGAGSLEPGNAAGFHAFVDAFRAGAFPRARAAKGQTMGPVTLSCAITTDGEPLLAREDLLRVVADHVVRAGGWQATVLGSLSPAVIVVLDEAYLGAALRRWPQWAGRVADVLRTSILRIRRPGVFVGLHCCDEIPFPLLERIAPDLYSFDAAQGAEAMADDPHVAAFVSGGGRLAWGWIPTRDDLSGVRAEEVADRWWDAAGCVARLAGIEPETLLTRSLVTAACGLGGSSEETCGQSFALAAEVSRRFARRCGKA